MHYTHRQSSQIEGKNGFSMQSTSFPLSFPNDSTIEMPPTLPSATTRPHAASPPHALLCLDSTTSGSTVVPSSP
jgi:hypothetical protein